jgi:hypothetical protein
MKRIDSVTEWTTEDGQDLLACIRAKEFDPTLPLAFRVEILRPVPRVFDLVDFEQAVDILVAFTGGEIPRTATGRPGWKAPPRATLVEPEILKDKRAREGRP